VKEVLNKEDLDEIKEIIQKEKLFSEEKLVPIVFDGKQYSIRIPKKFVDATDINTKKDKFLFKMKLPKDFNERPSLTAKLIKNQDEKKQI